MVAIQPKGAPPHPDEAKRLQALCSLGVLDTPPHERFDRLTRLAARLFEVPIALVSLVDTDRQWFKSRVGLDAPETPREQSFCAHAILDDGPMVVPDASRDVRFSENPLVLGPPDIRFYAGIPIRTPEGLPLGTLCVIDRTPRAFDAEDMRTLHDLAALAEQELHALSMSTLDELTGLTNRRGLEVIAPHVLAYCRRAEHPASLLLFDLNGFKAVNDEHGHAEGDRVLRGFADALLGTFRDSDVVARVGGDEFCVLLSGAREEEARRPLEELTARTAEAVAPHAVSFSVGITTLESEDRESFSALLAEADERMYADKRTLGEARGRAADEG